MPDKYAEIDGRQVLAHARYWLALHLPLQAEGYACTTDDLLNVWLGVAANQGTIEAVCADLLGTPDSETVRILLQRTIVRRRPAALGAGPECGSGG